MCQCPPLLCLLSDAVSKERGLVKVSSSVHHLRLSGGCSVAPPSHLQHSECVCLCPAAVSLTFPCLLATRAWARSASLKAWQQPRGLWFSGSWLSAGQGVRSLGQGPAAKWLLPTCLGEGWQSQSRTDAKGLNGECFKMLLRPHLDVTTTRGLLLGAGDSVCLVEA